MNRAAVALNTADFTAPHGLVVREFNHAAVFGTLAGAWNELFADASLCNPFLTALWQELWWRHWHRNRRLNLLALYQSGGHLCGIAPLCSEHVHGETVLMLLGSTDFCDLRDFIVAKGSEARCYEAVMAYITSRIPHSTTLILHSIHQHSPTLAYFKQLAEGNEVAVTILPEDTAPWMDLPSDFEIYLQRLRAKERHELRRKIRRVSKEGSYVFERICDASGVMAAMPSFLHLFRSSVGMKPAFLTPEREKYFLAVADAFASRKWLSLYRLSLHGHPIAVLFCFDYNNTLYLYNAVYDRNAAQLSPGIVAIALCIEDAIRRGIRRFEFLRGSEIYKYRFGARDRHLYTVTCTLSRGYSYDPNRHAQCP